MEIIYLAKISVDFKLENPEDAALVFGTQDKYLTLLEHQLSVEINYRGEMVQILAADDASGQRARKAIQALQVLVRRGVPVHTSDVIIASQMVLDDDIENFTALYEVELTKDAVGKPIRLKNLVQKTYVDAVKHHDVVFGIGPAGTGKTFLAVVMAVQALRNGQVKRIILTRPAVEAGESLGFLPGDLQEKVDPYLRPVYDALYMILGKNATERMMERGIIEIAPLAYMRGRTLDDAFVILDEAQNTTTMQMKMFLTRLGFNSKMIVNGDISQIDLPSKVKSGLIDATEKLSRIQAIDFIYFTAKDVVRHPVVAEIINAYEKNSSGNCFKFQIEC
ncbi:PhoH family protein [Lactococcus fujiensis]|uniref:PhoH family protein n=1 Tax=Lactococcus fujiensis TaxID=610251 RepID=UPI0006D25013